MDIVRNDSQEASHGRFRSVAALTFDSLLFTGSAFMAAMEVYKGNPIVATVCGAIACTSLVLFRHDLQVHRANLAVEPPLPEQLIEDSE